MAMKNVPICRTFTVAALVVLALFAAAASASAGGFKPYRGSAPIIAAASAGTKTVTLDIIGAQRGSSNSFNFNGFSNGDMVIKVPAGWTVTVHFSVQGSLAHSAIIVPWSQRQAFSFTKAFPGSAMPGYQSGISGGEPPVDFSFTASNAGRYAIVCAVPGHDSLGMWDEFEVVSGLAKPEVLVR